MDKTRYDFIDILKIFFAICVVAVHTRLFSNSDNNLHWYLNNTLFYLSVPYFFVTLGFFLGKKINEKPREINNVIVKTIKRLMIPLSFYLIVSIPCKFIMTYHDIGKMDLTILRMFKELLFYPWSSMWFLHASIIAILFLSVFIKHNKIKLLLFINIFLYIICLLPDSYAFVLPDCLKNIFDIYLSIFITTRNGIFAGLPFITAGYYISLKEQKIQNTNIFKYVMLFLVFSLMIIIETTVIKKIDINHSLHYTFFIFSIPVVVSMLLISIKLKNIKMPFNTTILRNISTSIYFMHSTIISYILLVKPTLSTYKLFILVFLIIFIIIIPLYLIDNKKINEIIK